MMAWFSASTAVRLANGYRLQCVPYPPHSLDATECPRFNPSKSHF